MKKSKIIVDDYVLDKIANSTIIDNNSKLSFMKYILYMTKSERRELMQMI